MFQDSQVIITRIGDGQCQKGTHLDFIPSSCRMIMDSSKFQSTHPVKVVDKNELIQICHQHKYPSPLFGSLFFCTSSLQFDLLNASSIQKTQTDIQQWCHFTFVMLPSLKWRILFQTKREKTSLNYIQKRPCQSYSKKYYLNVWNNDTMVVVLAWPGKHISIALWKNTAAL